MGSWRRAELKAGVYDDIVSTRLDRQLAALGADFDVHRAHLTASEPIGAVLESLLGDGLEGRQPVPDREPTLISNVDQLGNVLELLTDEADRRLARMLFVVLYGKEIAAGPRAEAWWAEHALLREEIAGLVPVLRELNAVLAVPHALAPEIPLVLHAAL